MNDDMRRIMAKHNPEMLKTVTDKALYGELPEVLTVGEIAELWSKDGLVNGSDYWKNAVNFLLRVVKDKKLACENMDIANGCIDPTKAQYEAFASGLLRAYRPMEDVHYKPINAPIKRSALNNFLDENKYSSLIKDFLIERWFLTDKEPSGDISRINPVHKEGSASANKDESAWNLVDTHPTLSTYLQCRTKPLSTKEKAFVKSELINHSGIFNIGFAGWWKSQIIFKKGSGGPGNN